MGIGSKGCRTIFAVVRGIVTQAYIPVPSNKRYLCKRSKYYHPHQHLAVKIVVHYWNARRVYDE